MTLLDPKVSFTVTPEELSRQHPTWLPDNIDALLQRYQQDTRDAIRLEVLLGILCITCRQEMGVHPYHMGRFYCPEHQGD